MPKTSIAEAIVGWDKALLNAKTNAAEVPGIQGYMTPLEEILAEARALSASLDELSAGSWPSVPGGRKLDVARLN